uniref:Uncharacterized protein n=1 Tax=Amphimedon queenslandica TaxID=400682 RepID=A0A1X7SXM8_AMPQE
MTITDLQITSDLQKKELEICLDYIHDKDVKDKGQGQRAIQMTRTSRKKDKERFK